ncbi:MAG: tail fiber domain-containing protein [Bacteroidota bacterium]
MKQLTTLGVLLSLCLVANAQVKITPDSLGIGTSEPEQKLHVSGGRILLENGNFSTYYELDTDNSNSDLGILFRDGGTPRSWIYRDGSTNILRMSASSNAGRNDLLVEGNTGNLGIGLLPTNDQVIIGHLASNTSAHLKLQQSSNLNYAHLEFANAGLTSNWQIKGGVQSSGEPRLHFSYYDGTDIEDYLSIDGTNGQIGVGITTPTAQLDVRTPPGSVATAGPTYGINVVATSATTQNSFGVYSQATGAIGPFGDPPGNYSIYGTTVGSTPSINNHAGYFDGRVTVTGTFSNPSDRLLKQHIKSLRNSSDVLMQLRPVSYLFRDEHQKYMALPDGKQLGFVAQEVEKVLPDLVIQNSHPRADKNLAYKSVNYLGFIPLLTRAFQEQEERLNEQAAEIEVLMERLAQLEKMISTSDAELAFNQLFVKAQTAYLSQNRPNPFSEQTLIEYYIPNDVKEAILLMTDLNGQIV